MWCHRQHISSNNDHHTPLLNIRIWEGAFIKNVMFSMPYLVLKNFKNQDLWAKIFQIAAISIFCYIFNLISLMVMLLFQLRWLTHAPWLILPACLWKCTCLCCCKMTLSWLGLLCFLAQVVCMCLKYNSILSTTYWGW